MRSAGGCCAAPAWTRRTGPMMSASRSICQLQFRGGNLLSVVMDSLKQSGLPPKRLELEIKRVLFRSDRKSTRLNSSHQIISYAVFCLKKKNNTIILLRDSNIYTTHTI